KHGGVKQQLLAAAPGRTAEDGERKLFPRRNDVRRKRSALSEFACEPEQEQECRRHGRGKPEQRAAPFHQYHAKRWYGGGEEPRDKEMHPHRGHGRGHKCENEPEQVREK